MMRKGGETPDEEKARFKESRALRQGREGDPRRRPRHRLRARRPGDLPDLGVRGQAVRQGRDLRRDVGLQPRLRRALPVDAPEADHRLALRQRLGVQQGQRADRAGQDPPGAVADDGLRGRRRGAPADAREQAPRQDRDPRRRRGGGRGQDRRGARARSAPRSAPDGRGDRYIPWYATGFRADKLAEALAEIAPVALRYGATDYAVYRSRDDRYKFLQTRRSRTRPTSSATGTGRRGRGVARAGDRAGTRCRSSTHWHIGGGADGLAMPAQRFLRRCQSTVIAATFVALRRRLQLDRDRELTSRPRPSRVYSSCSGASSRGRRGLAVDRAPGELHGS